jgi:hypothetical protein
MRLIREQQNVFCMVSIIYISSVALKFDSIFLTGISSDINVPLKLDLPHLLKVVNDRSHTSRHDVSLIKAVSYSSRDNADYVHSRYRLSANRVLLQDIISAFDQGLFFKFSLN